MTWPTCPRVIVAIKSVTEILVPLLLGGFADRLLYSIDELLDLERLEQHALQPSRLARTIPVMRVVTEAGQNDGISGR